jgi:hypothetical protein
MDGRGERKVKVGAGGTRSIRRGVESYIVVRRLATDGPS